MAQQFPIYVDPATSPIIDEVANAAEAKGKIPFSNNHDEQTSHPAQTKLDLAIRTARSAYKEFHGHEARGAFNENLCFTILNFE
jgi:hypothetical protein